MKVRLELNGYIIDLTEHPWGLVPPLDLGHPEVRVVTEYATDADGTNDTTELIGARTVTLLVEMFPTVGWSLWDLQTALKRFTSPRARPNLLLQVDDDAPEVRMQLRHSGWSTQEFDQFRQMAVVQFVAPAGILESAELHEASAFPSGEGAEVGRAYDLTFDRTYPSSPVLGSRTVINAGTVDAYPVLRIYGPVGVGATPPDVTTLHNLTTGKKLVFTDLEVAAGDYCEIDTRRKTIRINGLSAQSRYDKLTFPDSDWWTLVPGANELRFSPTTATGVAELRILWRSAWL